MEIGSLLPAHWELTIKNTMVSSLPCPAAMSMPDLYFTKVPFRNAFLRLCNRFTKGNELSRFLRRCDVNLVLDVGANKGQYGRALVRSGYRGRIVSFEPLPNAFEKLRMNRWGFRQWQIEPFALGGAYGKANFNIAANSQSSSLQPMLPSLVNAAPSTAYVGTCEVQVQKLDDIFERYYVPGDRCYLKIDVQGHEHEVILGATKSLRNIMALQIELSMQPLYSGAQTWRQAIEMLNDYGYRLVKMEPGFSDQRTGEMLQADGFFLKEHAIQSLKSAA